MLDLTQWTSASAVDELSEAIPSPGDVSWLEYPDAVEISVDTLATSARFPTLPPTEGAVLAWIAAPNVRAEIAPGYFGRIAKDGDPNNWPSFPGVYLPAPWTAFPADRSISLEERYWITRSKNVVLPKPGRESEFDFRPFLRFPNVYLDRDAAEILFALTYWHTKTNNNAPARDLLDRDAFLAYSARMADPRYRQGLTFWTRPGRTTAELVEELIQATDAIAYWTPRSATEAPELRFGLRDPRDLAVYSRTLRVTDDDPGASLFLVEDLQVRTSSRFRVTRLERAAGGLVVETGALSTPSTSLVQSPLPADENVDTLEDATAADDYGARPIVETLKYCSDYRSVVGPFRLADWSGPAREVAFGCGPIAFDFAPADVIKIEAPAYGLDGTERLLVRAIEYDLQTATATVEAVEIGSSTPSLTPGDVPGLFAHYVADDYDTATATWPDRSPNAYDATPLTFGTYGNPTRLLSLLNGRPGIRFDADGLQIAGLSGRGPFEDSGFSYLVVALLLTDGDPGSGVRHVLSSECATVWQDYNVLGVPARVGNIDRLSLGLGAWGNPFAGIGYNEGEDGLDRVDNYPGGAQAPDNAWSICVWDLYGPRALAESTPNTGAFEDLTQGLAVLSVFDPATGALIGVEHRQPFPHKMAALGGPTTIGCDRRGDRDSVKSTLHELLVFERSAMEAPYTPDVIDGLVHYLRTSWGFA